MGIGNGIRIWLALGGLAIVAIAAPLEAQTFGPDVPLQNDAAYDHIEVIGSGALPRGTRWPDDPHRRLDGAVSKLIARVCSASVIR